MKKSKIKEFTITAKVVLDAPTLIAPDDISIDLDLDIAGNYTIDEPTITLPRESFLKFFQDVTRLDAKTQRFDVRAKAELLTELGVIKWFGRWRKYAFFPRADCVFDSKCLAEIEEFIRAIPHPNTVKAFKDL